MKNHIVATALFALVLAPCDSFAQADNNGARGNVRPGTVRITTRAAEPDKWEYQRSANGTQRQYKCKPLACPEAQRVSFTFSKSPTRKPDPQALEKFAKIDLPKSIRAAGAAREVLSDGAEKIETLKSETASLKGYPAVINESQLTRVTSVAYLQIAIIFAGPVMVRVQSLSPNRNLSQEALKEFIDLMQIEEGPPAPEPVRPGQPRTGTQSL